MKRFLKIFLLLASIGAVSCRNEVPDAAPATFRVDFSALTQTRATSAFVPANRTVRVVVYRSHQGATEPDFTRECLAENTYYFSSGSNASLTACAVDASGVNRNAAGTVTAMTLPFFAKNDPGYFDIYVYSPAIPLNPDGKSVTVTNNMDFMAAALIGYQIPGFGNIASTTITLPDMKRYCSAIAFKDLYTENNVYLALAMAAKNTVTDRYQGIAIDNLCSRGNYVLGTDSIAVDHNTVTPVVYLLNNPTDDPASKVPAMNNPYVDATTIIKTRLGTCTTAKPAVYSNDLYVLPGAAKNPVARNKFVLRIDLRFWSDAATLTANSTMATLITPPLDGDVFKKGGRTEYKIKVVYDGVSASAIGFPLLPITDWQAGDEQDNVI